MVDLTGKTLGAQRVLREIGRGGMAVVYEAYQPLLARRVAIKMLLPHFATDTALVRRFLQEARSAASLTHPNIVTIYDVVEQHGQYYIVMQLLPGQPLSQLILKSGSLPLPRAAQVVAQIASALDYAHGRGVVHRDVKPANIIVGPDGHAVLTDFGVARAAESASLTSFGAVIGTPEYMSPEQARGETAGPASDIYSLGVVLYEMLAGRAPFRAPNTPALLYKHVYEMPAPVRGYAPDLPEGVEPVLARALAKPPEARFATAADLAKALQALPVPSGAPFSLLGSGKPLEPARPEYTTPLPTKTPAAGALPKRPPTPPPAPGRRPIGWLLPALGATAVFLLVASLVLRSWLVAPPPMPGPIVAAEASPVAMNLTSTPAFPEATPAAPASSAAPGQGLGTPKPAATQSPAAGAGEPTSTLEPTRARVPPTPTKAPVAASNTAPPSSSGQRGRTLPPPVPQQPNGRDQAGPQIVFNWLPGAHALSNTEGYALLVWSPDKQGEGGDLDLNLPSPGDFCGYRLAETQYTMSADTLQQSTWGGAGSFRWTVVIVDTKQVDASGRCSVVSQKGDVLTFKYTPTGGGGQCQPPAGGCPPRTSWDQATCSCK